MSCSGQVNFTEAEEILHNESVMAGMFTINSSLLDEQNKKKHVETCNVGLTYDIIDELLSMPIIVPPTNPSCSTSTSTLLVVMVSLVMPH